MMVKDSLFLLIYSCQGGPTDYFIAICFFCYLMTAFFVTDFCYISVVFGNLVGPLWWWAPGHCPNAHRVSPPLLLTRALQSNIKQQKILNNIQYQQVLQPWICETGVMGLSFEKKNILLAGFQGRSHVSLF